MSQIRMQSSKSTHLEIPPLSLTRYRLTLAARERLQLPPYVGSTLRGGFGVHFKRMVCFQPQVKTCKPCLLRYNCPYPYLFESFPPLDAKVLSKQDYVERPLVIEPPLDRRSEYEPGEKLTFHLVLVGRAQQYLSYLVVAFQELGRAGLGKNRGQFRVARVEAVHPLRDEAVLVYDEADSQTIAFPRLPVTAAELEATAATLPTNRLTVEFLTPTRLKHRGRFHQKPEFHVLVRALLRRTSSLAYFHGGERWETDYRGWIEQAEAVRTVAAHTRWVEWQRYSTRQKQRTSIGGAVGRMVYEGDRSTGLTASLAPFRPLLALGEWIHVGKACVFGNGLMRVS